MIVLADQIVMIDRLKCRLAKVRSISTHYLYGSLLRDEFADERRDAQKKFKKAMALVERIQDKIDSIKEAFKSGNQVYIEKVAMEYLHKYGFDRALTMLRRKIDDDRCTAESAIAIEAVKYLKTESSRQKKFNTHKPLWA